MRAWLCLIPIVIGLFSFLLGWACMILGKRADERTDEIIRQMGMK